MAALEEFCDLFLNSDANMIASLFLDICNTNPEAMLVWKFNVLEVINLAVEAWGEIPASTIFHCWQKDGYPPSDVVAYYEMILRKATQISVASLHDEDLTTISIESHTIEMSAHVKKCMDAGLTCLAGLNNEFESPHIQDPPSPHPIISGTISCPHMTSHLHITEVNMLAIFGNPEMLGKQSGKRPFRLFSCPDRFIFCGRKSINRSGHENTFRPNSDLWKQLRPTTWQPSSRAKTNTVPSISSIRYASPSTSTPPTPPYRLNIRQVSLGT